MESVRWNKPIHHTDLPERDPRIGEMVRVCTRRWLVDEVTEPANGGSSRVRLACAADERKARNSKRNFIRLLITETIAE